MLSHIHYEGSLDHFFADSIQDIPVRHIPVHYILFHNMLIIFVNIARTACKYSTVYKCFVIANRSRGMLNFFTLEVYINIK